MHFWSGLIFIGGIVFFLVNEWYKGRRPGDAGVDVQFLRGPPVIDTLDYGPVVPQHWEPETNTSGHLTVKTAEGRVITMSEVHKEELHQIDVIHCIMGRGQYEYIPKSRAQERKEDFQDKMDGTKQSVKNKLDAQESKQNEKLEKTNSDLRLQQTLDLVNQVPQQGGPRLK